jgi:hypothetical protein
MLGILIVVKTQYIYNPIMAKLINIRLNDEDEARVAELRERGVEISELVRSAIREAYDRQGGQPRTAEDVRRVMKELDELYPTPADAPTPVDGTDRRAVRERIGRQLRRKRVG